MVTRYAYWQIDELVVQALKLEGTSKEGRKEIESFSNVLFDTLVSLKVSLPLTVFCIIILYLAFA